LPGKETQEQIEDCDEQEEGSAEEEEEVHADEVEVDTFLTSISWYFVGLYSFLLAVPFLATRYWYKKQQKENRQRLEAERQANVEKL